MLSWKQRLFDVVLAVALIVLCLFILYRFDVHLTNIFQEDIPTPGVNVSVQGTPSKPVAKKKKVAKPLKTQSVDVYPDEVKGQLKLPQSFKDDENWSVIASTQIPADRHSSTATSMINRETGETETQVKRDPLPWIGADHSGDIGVYALQKRDGQVWQVDGKISLFQLKALNIGAKASIEQPINGPGETDYRAGFGGWVNF